MNFDNLNGVYLPRVLVGNPGGKRPLEKIVPCVNTDHRPPVDSCRGLGEACLARCGLLSCRGGGHCGTASGRRDSLLYHCPVVKRILFTFTAWVDSHNTHYDG